MSGFWYRINKPGKGRLKGSDYIDVIVEESLTDGTIIQDMRASGNVVTQRLKEFPAIFYEAISLLDSQGEMTLVVPPELAYGNKGYPPKIPAGAVMVYEIMARKAQGVK